MGSYSATFADELVVPFEEMKGTSRYVNGQSNFHLLINLYQYLKQYL